MLQLKVPLSKSESEVLVRCLSQLEKHRKNTMGDNPSAHSKNMSALMSAKHKVYAQVYDDFYRDEIINMVYALDHFSRECNSKLTENTPPDTAAQLSGALRTAASARSKLRRATAAD